MNSLLQAISRWQNIWANADKNSYKLYNNRKNVYLIILSWYLHYRVLIFQVVDVFWLGLKLKTMMVILRLMSVSPEILWWEEDHQQPTVCMDFGLFILSYLFRNPISLYLPTTFKLKVWLSLGTVETWHSNLPASRAVTYFNLSVHRPCRDGINSYLSSWTKRSRPMKSICASTLRTHDT